MARVWVGDIHLGHGKVAALRGFNTIVEHDDTILHQLSKLNADDQVWVMGDVSSGKPEDEDRALQLLSEIDAKLHLIAGNHDCLDSETKAVTKRGVLPVEELTLEDEVLTVDDDMQAMWARPEKIHRYPFDGDMIRLQGSRVDALVTPNHRIITRYYGAGEVRGWREAEAENFEQKSNTVFVTAGYGSSEDYPISDRDIALSAWLYTDSHRLKNYGYWTFYQSGEKADRLLELLPEGSYSTVTRQRDTTEIDGKVLKSVPLESHDFRVRSGPFQDHLSALVPDRTRLSAWVWKLSRRQVEILIREWEFTDGTIPTNKKNGGHSTALVLYCSREGLRHDLMALLVANGYRASETEYRAGHWRINACRQEHTRQPLMRISKEKYTGEVWCLTVPHGRFFVFRNGKIHLTGNSVSGIHRNGYKQQRRWLEVFESVQDYTRVRLYGRNVLMSHYPYARSGDGPERPGARYMEWRLPDTGKGLIHAHTHQSTPHMNMPAKVRTMFGVVDTGSRLDTQQMCVSWDVRRGLATEQELSEWAKTLLR